MKANQRKQNNNRVTVVFCSLGIGLSVIGVICFIFGACFKSMEVISLGLALVSVGLGFVALYLAKMSDNRMKAMARLEFREKIAMMHDYMEREKERREADINAAEELRGWVDSDLQREYDELKEKMDNTKTAKVSESGKSKECRIESPQASDSEIKQITKKKRPSKAQKKKGSRKK